MRFLAVFVHRLLDFRWEELDTVLLMLGLNPEDCYDQALRKQQLLQKVTLEGDLREQQHKQPQDEQDEKERLQYHNKMQSITSASLGWSPFLELELPDGTAYSSLHFHTPLLHGAALPYA